MRTTRGAKSLWQESMRIGLPQLDAEHRNVMELLELLEVRPIFSIASETFINRFSVVQAATEKFINYEESLMQAYPLAEETKRLHCADHQKIRTILDRIHADAKRRKNQTALDVYKSLRAAIEKHVATFGMDIRDHLPPPAAAKEVRDTPGTGRQT